MTAKSVLDTERNVFLEPYLEKDDGSLELVLAAGRPAGPAQEVKLGEAAISGCVPIEVLPDSPRWVLRFPSYLAFTVRDESYAIAIESDIFEGQFVRKYRSSAFLEFVEASTCFSEVGGEPIAHYGLSCVDHVIDVATSERPEVAEVAA